ncbi:unnamed protein product, partial [Dibothriocephalus latus]
MHAGTRPTLPKVTVKPMFPKLPSSSVSPPGMTEADVDIRTFSPTVLSFTPHPYTGYPLEGHSFPFDDLPHTMMHFCPSYRFPQYDSDYFSQHANTAGGGIGNHCGGGGDVDGLNGTVESGAFEVFNSHGDDGGPLNTRFPETLQSAVCSHMHSTPPFDLGPYDVNPTSSSASSLADYRVFPQSSAHPSYNAAMDSLPSTLRFDYAYSQSSRPSTT